MNNWNGGYITDIAYTHDVHRELTPAVLSFAALIAGVRSCDPNKALTYCELGCGQGVSANLLAAANPHVEFFATDFNPSHIVGARDLAAQAGTPNVRFFDKSFKEFDDEPGLPQFDVIALHGIYSWVSPGIRRDIVDFIRNHLKAGGLVYISYNALPGWASYSPMARLMSESSRDESLPTPARLEQSLTLVQRLVDVNPLYFQVNPAALERFTQAKQMNRHYVAHEYLNRHSQPFYHADVAADLSAGKLTFVGSAALTDSIQAIGLTREQAAFLRDIPNPGLRETMLDFILNRQFRNDVFVKGPVALSAAETHERWSAMRFALSVPRADVPLTVKTALGVATLRDDVYNPIVDCLAKNPSTVQELLCEPSVGPIGIAQVTAALTVLTGMGHVQPCLDGVGDVRRSVRAQAFNDVVIERARSDNYLQYLASPVTGAGILLDRASRLFMLALREGDPDPPLFAWKHLEASGHRLSRDNKLLGSPEENLAEARCLFETFVGRRLPVLRSMGIV